MATLVDSLVAENKEVLAALEKILGYRFTNLRLLQQALIHSSYAFENGQPEWNNETLEFIGDAVLDLVIGHVLFKTYTDMREGEMTKLRAALVNETHLAIMARGIDLGDYLYLGKGEESSCGRNKSSILSCAYEAVMGAVFEDGGYTCACELIESFFVPTIEEKKEKLLVGDAKSRLQETLQRQYNEAPVYNLDDEQGPSHKKIFTASVLFRGEVLGTGIAGSKKEAEQIAAATALEVIDNS